MNIGVESCYGRNWSRLPESVQGSGGRSALFVSVMKQLWRWTQCCETTSVLVRYHGSLQCIKQMAPQERRLCLVILKLQRRQENLLNTNSCLNRCTKNISLKIKRWQQWWCRYPIVVIAFYRPQTKLREGNVFTPACDSVHRGCLPLGRGVYL